MKTIFLKGLCGLSLVMIPEAVLSSSKDNLKSVSPHQYTHLIETYQSQTFEPLSQTALFSEQSASVSSFPKLAKVYFISKDGEQVFGSAGGNNTFEDPTIKQCIGDGYKYNASNCPSGLPADTCPYNIGYFKICCDVAYNYTEENCSLLNKSSSCGNKYKCDCSEEKYPVTANSCTSPQIPAMESGASCTVNGQIRYTKCVCPTGVNASYGCETYYASPCNTVCKKAKSDNCDNRTAVQTPYGCEKYFADCASKCEKAYSDNCRNRIAVSAPNGCEQYYADCSSKCEVAKTDNCANRTAVSTPNGCEKYYADCPYKCEIAKADNCANRTAVSAPYGCKSYYSDCYTKCKTAYTDNCLNRTAVSIPANATCSSYYSDCSSKCSAWSCKSGYKESFGDCKLNQSLFPILYGDGTLSKEILSNKTPIGMVFDETNRLAISLFQVESDGSVSRRAIYWGTPNKDYDIPSLTNCDEGSEIDASDMLKSCDVDGRANTDKILAGGLSPAAKGCNLYEPAGCTKAFCKKGKWFLPSMRDLINIYNIRNQMNDSMYLLLGPEVYHSIANSSLWSSNERGASCAWQLNMRAQWLSVGCSWGAKHGSGDVWPVVHYE